MDDPKRLYLDSLFAADAAELSVLFEVCKKYCAGCITLEDKVTRLNKGLNLFELIGQLVPGAVLSFGALNDDGGDGCSCLDLDSWRLVTVVCVSQSSSICVTLTIGKSSATWFIAGGATGYDIGENTAIGFM